MFSGTRRHTSFSRDWSSDVCSSDLMFLPAHGQLYSSAELDKNYDMVLKNPSVEIESTEAINLLYNCRFHEADREIRWLKYRFPKIGRASCRQRAKVLVDG